jgi:hypothetical protein
MARNQPLWRQMARAIALVMGDHVTEEGAE